MNLNTAKTVREVALEIPAATRVFEKLGIDNCEVGGKTCWAGPHSPAARFGLRRGLKSRRFSACE